MNIEAAVILLFTSTAALDASGQNLRADSSVRFSSGAAISVVGQNLVATGHLDFTSSAEVTVANYTFQGNARVEFSSTADITVAGQYLVATKRLEFFTAADLLVTQNLAAALTLEFTSKAETQLDQPLYADISLTIRHRVELDAGRDGLGVCDVVRHILLLWGIENTCTAPKFVRSAALDYLNAAMQIVWNQAKDRNYWTRSTQTVTLSGGESSLALGDTIQNVIGPARRSDDKRPLVLVNTRAEIDQFEELFLDGDSSGLPVGYHIERMNQIGKDPAACVFHVAPAPTESTAFLLDVVLEAPRFSWNDVDSCPRLPIPHRYVESLLLPIARYHAMSSHLFIFPDRAKQLTEDYAQAVGLLEAANPIPEPA